MTNKFIHEEISMLFCSEKFSGWWVVVVGDIAIIESSSRSRSPKYLRYIDLEPGLELDKNRLTDILPGAFGPLEQNSASLIC